MSSRPRLLFITPRLPETADSGGLQVSMERLTLLAQDFDTTVLALAASESAAASARELLNVREVHYGGLLRDRSGRSWMRSMAAGQPLSIWRNCPNDFMTQARSLADEVYDLAYIDHWLMWPAAQELRHAKRRVLHLHNAEHLLFERAAVQAKGAIRWALQIESARVRHYLRGICSEADEVHYLSHADTAEMARICTRHSPTQVFLPTVDVQNGRFGQYGSSVLFVGTMSWEPNAEGMRWYLNEVLPRLTPSLRTNIVGGYLQQPTPTQFDGRLNWLGRVADLEPYYREASVFIAPLLSGSGIKIKVLNALSHGIPVVTTSVGIEGFPSGWDPAISVADSAETFAAAIERLCSDRAHWAAAASAAKPYLHRHFSSTAFKQWSQQAAKALRA